MVSEEDFKNIRSHLASAVVEICTRCPAPRVPCHELHLGDPDACACRCEKVESLYTAMKGIKPDGGLL